MSERAQIVLHLVIVLGVMAAAVYGIMSSATAQGPRIAVTSAGPDASLIASTLRSPSLSPAPAPTLTPSGGTLSPTPTPRAPLARAYSFGGRSYTGVELGKGWTVVAPFDGRLELHVYQLIDREIREFTDVAGIPSYPYAILVAADGRRLTYRPGALSTDTELVARASQVKAGDDLFRVIGDGPSSWRDFYDKSVPFQIVVSLVSVAGADLDAAPLVKVK